MNGFLPNEEYTEVEGRAYINPQVTLDETSNFIDNLRQTQQQNNAQIVSETKALGTDVPSNLGGLTGAKTYWTSRYQTPQTNNLVADLRTTAQAAALSEALANEKAKWQKRYSDAYRAYQRRAWDKSNGGGTEGEEEDDGGLKIDVNPGDNEGGLVDENNNTGETKLESAQGGLQIYTDSNGKRWTLRNPSAGDEVLLGGITSVGGNLQRTFPDGTPLVHGAVYNAGGGRVFMYIENEQSGGGKIYRVADSPTESYN